MWFGYNVDEKNGFPAGCPVGVDFTPLPMSAGVSSHIPEMCTRVELVRLRCPTLSQRGCVWVAVGWKGALSHPAPRAAGAGSSQHTPELK